MHHATRNALASIGIVMLAGMAACGDARAPLAQDVSTGLSDRADPDRGRRLMMEKGCVACHVVPRVRAPIARVGPSLNNMGRQAYVNGLLANTPANLIRWLMDPPAVNPRTAMPNVGLTQTEAEDIAAFLYALPDG
ncbi:c-type cytochrome [Bordetella tumulicola]